MTPNGNDKLKAALLHATQEIEFHWTQNQQLRAALLSCSECWAYLEAQEAVFTPAFCWTAGGQTLKQRVQQEMARKALEHHDTDDVQTARPEGGEAAEADGHVDQARE